MYIPSHFAAPDRALAELVDAAPLADLITAGPRGLVVTPLPLLLVPGAVGLGSLHGHMARNNDHWHLGAPAPEASGSDRLAEADSLAIVRGPDAYVSPSFYPSKAEHGRVVPTWNYLTVHVHGRLVAHDEPAWTEDLIRRLTATIEGRRATPWAVDDAPAAFVAGQVRAIVGVELVITRVEAKYKLSQNRTEADQAGVIEALGSGTPTEQAVAARMRNRP